MLAIRSAATADIPVIREITMSVWPQTYTHIIGGQQVAYMLELFYSPEALEKQMQELHHQFIISYDGDAAIGFASYSEIKPAIFKLHKLYVSPICQGKGAGRYIITHITEDIKSKGAKQLRLNVNRHNTKAISFYRQAGFLHAGDEDIDIGGGYFMNDHIFAFTI